jgi:hypothetical protein
MEVVNLKFGILAWAWEQSLEYFTTIGLGNLWATLCWIELLYMALA